jgi:hypothetical protein
MAASYEARPLGDQPQVDVDPLLGWLHHLPEFERSIGDPDRGLDGALLDRGVVRRLLDDLPPPDALAVLADNPRLQRRIRSPTDCYLDLAQCAVPTSDGGLLLHLLADSQHVLHWLLYLGRDGSECTVVTAAPLGYDLVTDGVGEPSPAIVPVDGSFAIEVCAESLAEFLRRLWIEGEIFFQRKVERRPLDGVLRRYAVELGLS